MKWLKVSKYVRKIFYYNNINPCQGGKKAWDVNSNRKKSTGPETFSVYCEALMIHKKPNFLKFVIQPRLLKLQIFKELSRKTFLS